MGLGRSGMLFSDNKHLNLPSINGSLPSILAQSLNIDNYKSLLSNYGSFGNLLKRHIDLLPNKRFSSGDNTFDRLQAPYK